MYRYTECGLNNVWLENGYTIQQTPYGKAVAIADADDLDRAIAISLTQKNGRLTGKEFRFLRTQLGLAQGRLARMLGFGEQAVSLWERTGKVPQASDAVLRMLVAEKLDGNARVSDMIERFNTVDRLVGQEIVATTRRHRWTTKFQQPEADVTAA